MSSDEEELARDKDVYVTTHSPRSAREEAAAGFRYQGPCWGQAVCQAASGHMGACPGNEDPFFLQFSVKRLGGGRVLEILAPRQMLRPLGSGRAYCTAASGWRAGPRLGSTVPPVT